MELASIANDLAFVRQRVQRSSRSSFPATILFLWAGIVLAGSILTDVSPRIAGFFWLLATPTGGLASAYLGRRWAITTGRDDRRDGVKHGLHWTGLLVALLASMLPVLTGAVPGDGFGAQALLLVTVAYFYAGIHIHRSLLWLAGLQFVAYLGVVLIPGLPQTVTGAFTAAGFIWVGIVAQQSVSVTPALRLEQ